MKILFICEGNVGRSQMAEELFNKYSKNNKSISVGTNASRYGGRRLKEFAPLVIAVLKENGINVSEKIPRQLTLKIAQSTDKIICLTEKEKLPDYLITSSDVIFWNIQDAVDRDYKFHMDICNEIKKLVLNLVKKIG